MRTSPTAARLALAALLIAAAPAAARRAEAPAGRPATGATRATTTAGRTAMGATGATGATDVAAPASRAATGAAAPDGTGSVATASAPRPRRPPGPVPLVAIDAGHGGAQSGAHGACGLAEKDVTLDLSRRLAAILEASMLARPLLLRDDDQTLTLDARAAQANAAGAAVLISIHANSSPSPQPSGTETFFLAPHVLDQRLAPLVARENDYLPLPAAPSDDVQRTLAGLARDAAHAESQALALRVQRELSTRLHVRGRGVLQAPFMVLRLAHMAAVLVEVGFLSSPTECLLLRSAAHQDLVAEALATAILGHLIDHAGRGVPAGPDATSR